MKEPHEVPRPQRPGFTLLEVVVALALLAVVTGALLKALDRSSRFHAAYSVTSLARAQLAAAAKSLALELRTIAPGDLLAVADSTITYRSVVGIALVCAATEGTLLLAPAESDATSLSRWRAIPRTGDSVWLYAVTSEAPAGEWSPNEVSAASLATGACAASPLRRGRAWDRAPTWRLLLADSLPATPALGSPVVLSRAARFSLYRASGGDVNLGWADWNSSSGSWNTVQPVAGPLVTARRSGPPSLGTRAFGRIPSGNDSLAVATALELLLRAEAATRRSDGTASRYWRDSVRLRLAARRP
jgi:prepilin-type N-terminal cleavage/methylation domain-containing protein